MANISSQFSDLDAMPPVSQVVRFGIWMVLCLIEIYLYPFETFYIHECEKNRSPMPVLVSWCCVVQSLHFILTDGGVHQGKIGQNKTSLFITSTKLFEFKLLFLWKQNMHVAHIKFSSSWLGNVHVNNTFITCWEVTFEVH